MKGTIQSDMAQDVEFGAVISWADQVEAAALAANLAWHDFCYGPSPLDDDDTPPRQADRLNATAGSLRHTVEILQELAAVIRRRS